MTVSDAGAGSYWLLKVAVAEPPAGTVTVSGGEGVVVTCSVGVSPSTGSSISQVVPDAGIRTRGHFTAPHAVDKFGDLMRWANRLGRQP